jgi:hypothetical protein
MRFRSREQHAVVERVQKPRFADPPLFLDEDAMHDSDLSGRTAKAEHCDARPGPERLFE